jgi:hypothetical protein
MKIIGLGHYSRTGKDTFANALVKDIQTRSGGRTPVKKIPFAWKLKDICHQLYAWDGLREAEFYDTLEGEKFRDIKLPTIGKTPVEIWVAMGTPAVREQVYSNTWIDYLLKSALGLDVLVIPDVRFPNEVTAIQELGGTLIKVVRPGYGPRKTVADRALLGWNGWDYVIGSSGRMQELADWASAFGLSIDSNGSVALPNQTNEQKRMAMAVEVVQVDSLKVAA